MHLFRSEEHARRWAGFRPGTEAGLIALDALMAVMSTPRHREKLNGRYLSGAPEYAAKFFERIREVTQGSAFWEPRRG